MSKDTPKKKLTQITLELDLGDSSTTIENIFKSLTKTDKKKIAEKLVKSWVEQPISAERRQHEREVVAELMREKGYHGHRYKTEADARDSYTFKQRMDNWKSTREQMIEAIHRTVLRSVHERVLEIVHDNTQMLEVIGKVSQVVIENIPGMVQSALTQHFLDALKMNADHIHLETRFNEQEGMLQKIKEHLGIY